MNVEKKERDKQLEAEFLELLEASMSVALPERGEIRNATILQIDPKSGDTIVDLLGSKQDGIVHAQDLVRLDPEYKLKLTVGQTVPVYVVNPRDNDGNLVVSISQGLQQYDWDAAKAMLGTDDVVEVTITGHNRGGVLVRWRRLEGFIPSSHLITVGTGGSDRRDLVEHAEQRRAGCQGDRSRSVALSSDLQ